MLPAMVSLVSVRSLQKSLTMPPPPTPGVVFPLIVEAVISRPDVPTKTPLAPKAAVLPLIVSLVMVSPSPPYAKPPPMPAELSLIV